MVAARALLLLVPLVLAPSVAVGQLPQAIAPPVVDVEVTPRTPPPSSIPSAPPVALPAPPDATVRPARIFELRPTLGLAEEYTDNFTRSERDPTSNLRSTIAPGLLVLLDHGFLTGQAGYNLSVFHDTSQEDLGVFHALAGRLAWEATPRFTLGMAYALTQSDEPERADRLNLRQERRTFTRNTFALDATYALATVEVRPHYRLSSFSGSDQTTLSHTAGAGASLAIGRIHSLTAGYDYLLSETTRRRRAGPVAGVAGDSELRGHELTAALSRELSVRSSAGLSAAYAARQQTTSAGDSDFSRWSVSLFNNYVLPGTIILRGNIGVSQLTGDRSDGALLPTTFSSLSYWFGSLVAGLTVERGYSETFGQGENFGVVETSGASASLSYPFTPLVHGFIDVSYRENKFTGEGGGRAGEEETTLGGRAVLSIQLRRWLRSSLEYAYTDTSSSSTGRGFTENRVRLMLNAAF